jgi:hypothetical protein
MGSRQIISAIATHTRVVHRSNDSAQRERPTHDGPLHASTIVRSIFASQLERAIAARWKQWVPWVRMQQLRVRDYDPSVAAAESSACANVTRNTSST